jgi:GNAT superfamily N-acetyltransferase
MAAPRITMTDDPSRSDRAFLDERIYEYNIAATNIYDGRMMHFAIRDERDAMIAGLSGWTWGGCAAVEFLWVREDWRGKGLGTQLLVAAEKEAMECGCVQIVLDTHSFQAPEFYTKHGYEIYGVVDGYPRGFAHMHLKKQFDATR